MLLLIIIIIIICDAMDQTQGHMHLPLVSELPTPQLLLAFKHASDFCVASHTRLYMSPSSAELELQLC
jgi:hypothetical protein